MIKAGIIGCGKIADQHAESIKYTSGSRLVAVCDNEPLMGEQLKERFAVKHSYTDVDEMLSSSELDAVHITTPPLSHYSLGMKCMEAGCSVYIEKPFTLDVREARDLIETADKKGVKLTVGHNGQFSHSATRMRDLVAKGYLGGEPVHMESYFGYNLGDVSYAKVILGDRNHWVRALPGKLLHNIISHGVSRIAEYIGTEKPEVTVVGFSSPFLESIGEDEIIDELRVVIKGDNNATAYFTFSSQMRPVLHQFRLYGPTNGLIVDEDEQTVIKLNGTKYKHYLNHIITPMDLSLQYLKNFSGNAKRFIFRDFHFSRGMRLLIERFYGAIRGDNLVPIPYREIILTAEIMDAIFNQIYPER